ncbi:conjugal transfer protein TraG N-terminal domain-containing protein [Thermodesulfobacteriota bacterium B35]
MEFYTYGGFNPIVQAFNTIALIFSDHAYQGLIFVVTVLGIFAAATGWIAKAATGVRIVPMVWAIPVVFGAVMYLALFVPKGNITVYDTVLNRFQTIGGIPDAVVLVAGTLNKIEKGLIDIITTSGAPDADYKQTAGGIGFKALESIRGSSIKDSYLRSSTARYIRDCVTFELMRPGTTLSLDELRNNTINFLDDLGKAYNPSVYTVYYTPVHPEGQTMSCTDAWNHLRAIYANPANYTNAIKKVCGKMHFDPNNPVEINACKFLLVRTMRFTTGMAVTPERILQQRQIAEILYNFYFMSDYETSMLMDADRKITTTGLGIGLAMNEWIPIIRAIMTAIAIGMIPFLVLFLPTPIVGRAASVMFGFFVFLATWGVTDAVIHSAAMNYAQYAFEDMRQSNLGVYAMAAFPPLSVKMLGMFGVIRSAGIMLAAIFSTMLIRFGGSALAHLATNLTGIARSIGAQTGKLLTPEGLSQAMDQQIKAGGTFDFIPDYRYTNMAAGEAWARRRKVASYNAAMNARNTLEETGQIPAGTTEAEMADMMASGRVSAATSTGLTETTVGPDNNGMIRNTSPAGTSTFAMGENGPALTTATVNGLNPVTVGAMAQHQSIVSAAHNLGSSKNWQQVMDTARKASKTSSEAHDFTSRLDNTLRENWARAINDKSSFVHSMTENTRNMLTASISYGNLPILRRTAGGQAQLMVVGQNGEQVSFSVSEDVARKFENTASEVRSESLQQVLQDAKNLDYMTRLASQIGATEAYSYLQDAKKLKSSTESYGADLTTAFVKNYATERYGSASPENVEKAIGALNYLLTQGGVQGVKNVHEMVEGFVSGRGYGWGSTKDAVHEAIRINKAKAQGSEDFKKDIDMSAMNAGAKTYGIHEKNMSAPAPDTPLDRPNAKSVTDPADAIRRRNRFEESGKGGIKTTVGGMFKEIIGQDKHQPISPVSDLFRNDYFYNEGSLVGSQQRPDGGIVLPSGTVIWGDGDYTPPAKDENPFNGSIFEQDYLKMKNEKKNNY